MPWVLPWLVRDKKRRARAFTFISQLGIRYRDSPIVSTSVAYYGPLKGGDRAPDGNLRGKRGETSLYALCVGPKYHLVMFSGTGENVADEEYLKRAMKPFLDEDKGVVEGHILVAKGHVGQENYSDDDSQLHARYGFTEPGCALVRPDCYLAWIGPFSEIDQMEI